MNLSYFLKEVPMAKGKFMANAVSNGTISDREFLAAMNKNNPDYSVNAIKEVLKLMVDTAGEMLAGGYSILVPYFLKISPSIRGVFDSSEEGFTSSKHSIGINCAVSPVFSGIIEKKLTVEKIKKPDSFPKIKEIYDNLTKGNVIQKDFANRLKTSNMTVPGREFAGLLITCKSDLAKKAVIELADMDMIKHSGYELVFTIVRNFTPPEWLVNGMEILLQLRYRSENGIINENAEFGTKWAC